MEMKCPTVGHENPGFTGVIGWLLKIPMANPPIRASGLGGGYVGFSGGSGFQWKGKFFSFGMKWKGEFELGKWLVFGKSDGDPDYLWIKVGQVV